MTYTADQDRYDGRMNYNRCGRSGLKLPEISLGFWHNFGDVDDLTESRAIMHRAFDAGITHFDFANNYGPPPGSAETNAGEILRQDFKQHRDELIISSKAGYHMWDGPYGEWGSRKYILSSLDQSLKRLQMDYVDIFYHHRPDPDTPLEESMGALATAVNQGKALYAGISNYPAELAAEAITLLREMGTPCLIHQAKYSLLDRWIENGLTDTLTDSGVGCIAFSPLAQGMLTDRYLAGIPADSRAGKQHGFLQKSEVEEQKTKIIQLNEIAKQRGESLASMSLAWTLNHPTVTSTLIGASSVAQLNENLTALNSPAFSDGELLEINSILKH
ncbi:MAG: aldo/keto reductase [Akkermansiaceae bacterium]